MEIKNILCYDMNWIDAARSIHIRRKIVEFFNFYCWRVTKKELSDHGE